MQKQLTVWLVVLIAVVTAACGGAANQGGDDAIYESDAARFSYPTDFALSEPHANFVLVGTSVEANNSVLAPDPTLAEGDGVLEVRVFRAEDIAPQDYLQWLSESAADNPNLLGFGGMEEFTAFGSNGVVVDRVATGADVKNYFYSVGDGTVVRAAIYSAPGEFEETSASLLPVLESVEPNNPPVLTLDVEIIEVATEEAVTE